jgi:hypothetical protein
VGECFGPYRLLIGEHVEKGSFRVGHFWRV